MKDSEFSFGEQSVATAYDDVLVPILFAPWAERLVAELPRWEGKRVLDLASGTGVLASRLAHRVGARGKVIGSDINGEMLRLAEKRCAGAPAAVEFVESPAAPLRLPDASVDVVACQQGFQFFPDGEAAAREIHRVLRAPGVVVLSTWRPVAECEFFGAICQSLDAIEEAVLSQLMRVPFDFMPDQTLERCFEAAGFQDLRLRQERLPLVVPQGIAHAVEVAFATPIGPKLRALPERKQALFRARLGELLRDMSADGLTVGEMASNVLLCAKSC